MDARIKLNKVKMLTQQSAGESLMEKAIFTERDISELGKNYMTARGLQVGIRAYTHVIQRYALGGLLELFRLGVSMEKIQETIMELTRSCNNVKKGDVVDSYSKISWPILPWEEVSHGDDDNRILHKLKVLTLELPSIVGDDVAQRSFSEICALCLKKLCDLEMDHASQVLKSKKRDDQRGSETIPGYRDAHIVAEEDPVVLLAQTQAQSTVNDCKHFIAMLQDRSSKL